MKIFGLLLYTIIYIYLHYIIFTKIKMCENHGLDTNICNYDIFYEEYKIQMYILLWLLCIIPFYYEIFIILVIIITCFIDLIFM